LALAACGSANGHQLVVAGGSNQSTGLNLYAVDPGEKVANTAIVASGVTGPSEISVVGTDGTIQRNDVATSWAGQALVAATNGQNTLVTAAVPGERPTLLSKVGQARTTVLDRGVFVENQNGCTLTSSNGATEVVGAGRCSMSTDQRWVASWPFNGGDLRIRDLRGSKATKVPNLKVQGTAVALGRDARVVAEVAVGTSVRLVMVDGTNGKVIGRSTPAQAILRLDPKTEGAPGVVATVRTQTSTELWFMDTDGTTTMIDRAGLLLNVSTNRAITYLRYGDQLDSGAVIQRSDDGHVERLLRGKVGVGAAGAESLVLTRESKKGLEFFTTGTHSGHLRKLLTLPAQTKRPAAAPADLGPVGNDAVVDTFFTHEDQVWIAVTTGETQSLVRLDLTGDESIALLPHWRLAAINAIDEDGTALVSAVEPASAAQANPTRNAVQLVTIGAQAESPTVRLQLARPTQGLIHNGTIYLAGSGGEIPLVSTIERGENTQKLLYRNVQLAGALWPNQGGATTSTLVTPGLLTKQAQESQGAQQQGGGSAAGG